jgi:8-oxo-dGTP pyrophosphatase MutT (NUDIX family)
MHQPADQPAPADEPDQPDEPVGSEEAAGTPGTARLTGVGGLPGWWSPLRERVATMRAADIGRFAVPVGTGRRSAVLILLGESPAGGAATHRGGAASIDLVMTERPAGMRSHPGQCAFPGGSVDAADGGPVDTALREAAEEIGLRPASVAVVATLPELWLSVSDFLVTPVLAWWREPHPVGPVDTAEVARVSRLPVAALADPANRFRVRHRSGYTGPAFRVDGMLVWGFTGGIVAKLLELGGWERPWDTDRVEPLPG